MSLRLHNIMRWIWCLLVVHSGSIWSTAEPISVRNPPKNTAPGIEAQSKFFQDFFSVQLSPYKIEFGHVCEDPNNWEQRYEKKDFKNHRDMGKVRWGDKEGGYGEHYWDLNHAGHNDDHGNDGDDGYGSDHGYNHHDSDDSYDEISENSPQYETDGTVKYEQAAKYDNEDGNRNKRAHTRSHLQRKPPKKSNDEDKAETGPRRQKDHHQKVYNNKEQSEELEGEESQRKQQKLKKVQHTRRQEDEEDDEDDDNDDVVIRDINREPKSQKEPRKNYDITKYLPQEQASGNRQYQQVERKAVQHTRRREDEAVTDDKTVKRISQLQQEPAQYKAQQGYEPTKYLQYEQGSGVRQHQQAELATAASMPRLFWEPSTGHVVDRTTGQAYVLQPIKL